MRRAPDRAAQGHSPQAKAPTPERPGPPARSLARADLVRTSATGRLRTSVRTRVACVAGRAKRGGALELKADATIDLALASAETARADDPLWYKDAIIYELHVKAFFDSNDDGIGDFRGPDREARLPPGPGRHAHLAAAVLPVAAARRRLRHRRLPRRPPALRHAARTSARSCARRTQRGMRVITELVINHTSDQHPWFQAARRAPPGSPEARLLRLERHRPEVRRARASSSPTPRRRTGPGTRSPRQYYWHRFFSHQPDLNFDNPRGAAGGVQASCGSGSTWASTASGSTRSPT